MSRVSVPLDGYHIQIRDLSSPSSSSKRSSAAAGMFDVVTISGGVTRSYTLSDLRPATDYEVFVVPFFKRIKGMPSNLRTATTKEDGEWLSGRGVTLHQVLLATQTISQSTVGLFG